MPTYISGRITRYLISGRVTVDRQDTTSVHTEEVARRTSLNITDDGERTTELVASAPDDDPTMSVVINATLAHLLESEGNIRTAREYDPMTVQELCDSLVIGLQC